MSVATRKHPALARMRKRIVVSDQEMFDAGTVEDHDGALVVINGAVSWRLLDSGCVWRVERKGSTMQATLLLERHAPQR